MLRGETELADPFAKQLVLGLGLLFLGKQGAAEATVEVRNGAVLQSLNLKVIACARLLLIVGHMHIRFLSTSYQSGEDVWYAMRAHLDL